MNKKSIRYSQDSLDSLLVGVSQEQNQTGTIPVTFEDYEPGLFSVILQTTDRIKLRIEVPTKNNMLMFVERTVSKYELRVHRQSKWYLHKIFNELLGEAESNLYDTAAKWGDPKEVELIV
jgi:hypothetical protein